MVVIVMNLLDVLLSLGGLFQILEGYLVFVIVRVLLVFKVNAWFIDSEWAPILVTIRKTPSKKLTLATV